MNPETDCEKYFYNKFKNVVGFEWEPEINNKNPDFKIVPESKEIYFEIYRPEATKIIPLKDEKNWKNYEKGEKIIGKSCNYSLSIEIIKAIISLYIKDKKRKKQLPQNKPNILIIDLSHRFHESIHISDLISFDDSEIQDTFKILPTLTGIIFYGLITDPLQTEPIKFFINQKTNNSLTEEEIKVVEESLKWKKEYLNIS